MLKFDEQFKPLECKDVFYGGYISTQSSESILTKDTLIQFIRSNKLRQTELLEYIYSNQRRLSMLPIIRFIRRKKIERHLIRIKQELKDLIQDEGEYWRKWIGFQISE